MEEIEIEEMESLDNAIDEKLYTSMSPLMMSEEAKIKTIAALQKIRDKNRLWILSWRIADNP